LSKIIRNFYTTLVITSFSITTHAAVEPEHVALVDTGYDLCMLSGGQKCENNKNLLFRGGMPLPDGVPMAFDFDQFRTNLFAYLTDFKNTFETRAPLPISADDLKNYRIVDIDLIYDYNQAGGEYESGELQDEFKESGQVSTLQIPEQHKMYGLDLEFDPKKYAFEWWPVTFAELPENDPNFIAMNVNWPSKMGTPSHTFLPKEYKFLDMPYLVSGIPLDGDEEPDAKDLVTLLKTIPADGHPFLIYYHCIAGKDRTGAVSAAYMMKNGGYPYFTTVQDGHKHFREGPVSLSLAFKYTTLPDRYPWIGSMKLSKAYCLTLDKGAPNCTWLK
jgi:hypothetical protein